MATSNVNTPYTVIPVPSLSASGWVTAPAEKADLLMSHLYTSMYSQTQLYPDQVTSLQWIVQQYGHDISELTIQMQKWLNTYFNRYYTVADIRISNNDTASNVAGIITLTIDIVVNEGTDQYSIGALIKTRDSKLLEILRINNG